MIPGIPVEALTPLGAVAFVLVILILAVAFGLFIPRWIYKSVLKSKDDQIKFLLDLREIDNQRFEVIEGTVEETKVVGETLLRVVNALQVPTNKGDAT